MDKSDWTYFLMATAGVAVGAVIAGVIIAKVQANKAANGGA